MPSVIILILTILMVSCSQNPKESTLETKTNETAVQQTPLNPIVSLDNQGQGKILQLISDKVYQVLVKKKKDHLITYTREMPTENLPFELRESAYMSIGSAFSLTPGRFLSCAHVFNLHLKVNPEEFFLKDAMGKIYNITQIHKYSAHHDVIEFSLEGNVALPTIQQSTNHTIGQNVYSVGNALGVGISVRSGVLSSFTFEPDFGEWKNIRFSAPASPGNSGGPLINTQGQVLGIIQAKSENENLNYAYPINLLSEVSTEKAKVKAKQHFSPYNLREIFTIDYQENLPQKIDSLSRNLYAQFNKASKNHAEKFFEKYKNDLFHGDKKLETYLQFQTISKTWQKFIKKRNGMWSSYIPPFDSEKFEDGSELAFAITGQAEDTSVFFAHFLYYSKKAKQLENLLLNPAPVAKRAINHIIGGLKFGETTIEVKEIKEAEETYWYRDQLKRLWRLDFWRLKTYGLTIITACSAHPKGLACHLFPPLDSNYEGYGALSLAQFELDSWMLSPSGTIEQWREYLKLPSKYQWPILDAARIHLDKKNTLDVSATPYAFKMPLPAIFNRLEVSINLGYNEKLPLSMKNHGVSFFDSLGRSYFYQVPQLKPEITADDSQTVLWKQATLRQAEFSGDVYKDQLEKKLTLVGIFENGKFKELKANENSQTIMPKEIQKIFCYTDVHHSDQHIKDWCTLFSNQLRTTL
jgi:serine protease Do